MDSDIKKLTAMIQAFVAERDWAQFHDPKSMSMALAVEASELMEHFTWLHTPAQVESYLSEHREDVADEMADVMVYLLELMAILNVDPVEAVERKMKKNAAKYPVEKSKGNRKKYIEL